MLVNLALGATTSQFDTLEYSGFTWDSDKAVDGCTLQDNPETQQCCAASLGTAENFWRVDLNTTYRVSRVMVYGRNDGQGIQQTGGFKLHVTDGSGQEEQVYDNNGMVYGNGVFDVRFVERDVRAVRITRPDFSVVTLCEVEVYEACADGMYGGDCEFTCGQCQGGAPCDKVTGVCSGGCQPGWETSTCNIASTTLPVIQTSTSGPSTNISPGSESSTMNSSPESGSSTINSPPGQGSTDSQNPSSGSSLTPSQTTGQGQSSTTSGTYTDAVNNAGNIPGAHQLMIFYFGVISFLVLVRN
ncbi:uncharacterized protein LOC128234367 [Mya arenaria]|uniref:uncharacterized protein LOC128234367 n=1 Tax=Mya arenaria TaxID=6604 RepID=UPI0022DFA398|nr:uncharacterized protein LOC128234367 [Mya arenaria]